MLSNRMKKFYHLCCPGEFYIDKILNHEIFDIDKKLYYKIFDIDVELIVNTLVKHREENRLGHHFLILPLGFYYGIYNPAE